MTYRRSCIVGVAVISLMLAGSLLAQTTGNIQGRVVNENGEYLPGATVTLRGPQLQGSRIAVTDEAGRFRFLALLPGSYDLRTELEGFGVVEQQGVEVGLDKTATLEITITSGFTEELVVTGETPLIDTTSTTAGATFTDDVFQSLPTGRTYQGIAFSAPGVVAGGLGNNPSIGGASAAENRYIVDGLDTTDPAFGTNRDDLAFEFIKEVEVKTGAYDAEYGGALGGILNVVTKSGGNELEGDVFAYFDNDSLQDDVPPTETFGQDLGFTEYDYGVDIGGKLIEDKLWYFVAVNPKVIEEDYTGASGVVFNEKQDALTYAGKLTWQANPSHQFQLSVFGDDTTRDEIGDRTSIGKMFNESDDQLLNVIARWNGVLTSNLFSEVSFGRYDLDDTDDPGADEPRYRDGTSGRVFARASGCDGADGTLNFTVDFTPSCFGGTFAQDSGDRSRDEAKASMTWFGETGAVEHQLKFGAEIRTVEYFDNARYPGSAPGPKFDNLGVPIERAENGFRGQRYELRDGFYILYDYRQGSLGETDESALFVQDSMRIGDYFTLNLGVRADDSHSTGSRTAEFSSSQLDFSFGDMVAPRVGFTWDVAQNSRSKLYGHYGRFYESVPLDINARAFGNEIFELFIMLYPDDGSLPSVGNLGYFLYPYPLGVGVGVAEGIEPMYTGEARLGFEYEVKPNVAIGISAVQRDINNVIEDISVDGGHTYFITNPSPDVTYTVNPVTGEPLVLLDEDGEPVIDPVTGEPIPAPVTFPEAEREYEAFEITLNKRLSNNWQLYASYVHSENIGNYGGLFRQDNGQLDPNITSLFDLPSLLDGAFGLLPNDREDQFKVYGSYVTPINLVIGGSGQYLSGTPISQLGAHDVYLTDERFVTPRGSFGRTPDVWSVDLHLQYPMEFANGMTLNLITDVFNITGNDDPLTVDQTWTFADQTADDPNCGGPESGPACPLGNPSFGEPTQFQTPRTIRLGARLSF